MGAEIGSPDCISGRVAWGRVPRRERLPCEAAQSRIRTGRGALIRRSFSAGIFRVQFTDDSAVALR